MSEAQSPQYLRTYLADHHAASVGALALVNRMIGSNEQEPIYPILRKLRDDIDQDRKAFERIGDALGVKASAVKDGIARAASTMGRLKLNGRVTRYSPLSRVLELEALRSLIAAKHCLWKTLLEHSRRESRLKPFDLDVLERRASVQLERVDQWHSWAIERLSNAIALP